MKLNAYLAQAGVCSRRKAIELIKQGLVTVNHYAVTDPAYELRPQDTIRIKKKIIKLEPKKYIIFNKPAGCVTTVTDPHGRPTIMDFIKLKERVYPVGRLDFQTTGLLLLTNDGALAQQLAHPRYQIPKTYLAVLDRPFEQQDFLRLTKGIRLRDGFAKVDDLKFAGHSKKGLHVTIHSGKYRIVRRMFEHLGYKVTALSRIAYAGLYLKKLQQGAWRYLTNQEVEQLQALADTLAKRVGGKVD